MRTTSLLVLCGCATAQSSDQNILTLASFDGAKDTTRDWQTTNDPVMGGLSDSNFTLDTSHRVGVWKGEVRVVPKLGAPGFCNLQTGSVYSREHFPDVSSYDGIRIRARVLPNSLTVYNAQLKVGGGLITATWNANVNLTTEITDHFVPWSAFKCNFRLRPEPSDCPALTSQLKVIDSIGLSTGDGCDGCKVAPQAGPFDLEIESFDAMRKPKDTNSGPASVDLVTFDGAKGTTFDWFDRNDPVMGGLSTSTFSVNSGFASFDGVCRVVPSLKAPGFCWAATKEGLLSKPKFNDVSALIDGGLELRLRTTTPEYAGFKISFGPASGQSMQNLYKAPFFPARAADWQIVFVPFTNFSADTSDYTGRCDSVDPNGRQHHCCSKEHSDVCPQSSKLAHITQLGLWAEGVAGNFTLDVAYIRAVPKPSSGVNTR